MSLDTQDRLALLSERTYERETRLERTGLPRKYWDGGFARYQDRRATREIREFLLGYVARFAEPPVMHGGRGFALLGAPGVGKTMAAALSGVALSDAGYYVRFLSLARYVELLLRQMTLQQLMPRGDDRDGSLHAEWTENDRFLYALRNLAHLVILDDVGKEHRTQSGYAEDAFDLFLRERGRLGRPVAVTSNVPVTKWAGQYSAAMQDYLHEACEVFTVTDPHSMRERRGER